MYSVKVGHAGLGRILDPMSGVLIKREALDIDTYRYQDQVKTIVRRRPPASQETPRKKLNLSTP